jgi:ATP-dependent RNA helicase RhlB
MLADSERAPRKPRRRRSGKRIEDVASAPATPARAQPSAQVIATRVTPKPSIAGADAPSLLSRLGRGLKSLVTRAPRSQH